jgi:hypothetical protein
MVRLRERDACEGESHLLSGKKPRAGETYAGPEGGPPER